MRTPAILLVFGAAVLLTSCQSGPGTIQQATVHRPSAEGGAVLAGGGTPFYPAGRPLVSARYEPPDRYYGFGGGYSKTRPAAAGAYDDFNFLYNSDRRCRHWHRSYSCGTTTYASCGPSFPRYYSSWRPSYGFRRW